MTLARDTADFGRFGKNRNFLINGNFDIWQRGITDSAIGWAGDRWNVQKAGSSTANIARKTFTVGQTDVPNNPVYYMEIDVTTGSGVGDQLYFRQKVEDVHSFAGKTITLSFWMKATVASKEFALELLQNFGTSGSSVVQTYVGKYSLTTSWQKFEITISVPSISGKTVSGGDDYLEFRFWLDAGSTYDSRTGSLGNQSGVFHFAQAQVEEGYVATPFEKRPEAIELLMCLRYFQISSVNNHFGLLRASDSSSLRVGYDYVVPMRGTPSITLVGTLRLNHSISNYASSLSNVYHNDVDGATLVFSSLTGLTPTAGDCIIGDFGSNNGSSTNYITFDAEL